jgi:hypothetical protein
LSTEWDNKLNRCRWWRHKKHNESSLKYAHTGTRLRLVTRSHWGKSRLCAQDILGRSNNATEVRRGLLHCECSGQQAIVCYRRE